MPPVVFSTWSALYAAMLDQLADFVANRMQTVSYSLNTGSASRTLQYRNIADFRQGLELVKSMADLESGAAAGRTYAKQGGRG